MDKAAPTFVGVDVSKRRLDVHLRPSGEGFAIDHGEEEVAALVKRLVVLAPALVVLEATGGMEVRPAAALAAAGRWRWSTRARCAPSPAPPAGWPRPTAWTRP